MLLPPGRWYAGEPAGLVITTTAYIDTAFLEEQERWITQSSAPAPLVLSDSHRSDPTVLDVPSTVFPHVIASLQRLIDGERHHLPTLRRLSLAVDLLDILTRPVPEHSPEHPSVCHAMALLMILAARGPWMFSPTRPRSLDRNSPDSSPATSAQAQQCSLQRTFTTHGRPSTLKQRHRRNHRTSRRMDRPQPRLTRLPSGTRSVPAAVSANLSTIDDCSIPGAANCVLPHKYADHAIVRANLRGK